MTSHLFRSISEPIRDGLSWEELWRGPDGSLIFCWERGRQKRVEDPELAEQAAKGQLVLLAWRGGVERKLKLDLKSGTLQYLATWQGLRGEDLDINVDGERTIVCARTGQAVSFRVESPAELELEEQGASEV